MSVGNNLIYNFVCSWYVALGIHSYFPQGIFLLLLSKANTQMSFHFKFLECFVSVIQDFFLSVVVRLYHPLLSTFSQKVQLKKSYDFLLWYCTVGGWHCVASFVWA